MFNIFTPKTRPNLFRMKINNFCNLLIFSNLKTLLQFYLLFIYFCFYICDQQTR